MATHPSIAVIARALRDLLVRNLAAEVTAIETTEAKPKINGILAGTTIACGASPGKSFKVTVGTATAVTVTCTGTVTYSAAAAALNTGLTGAAFTAETLPDGTSRLILTGSTAATGTTAQHVEISAGTTAADLDLFGFQAGDHDTDRACPTLRRSDFYDFDVTDGGKRAPPVPCFAFEQRSAEKDRMGSEGLWTVPIQFALYVAAPEPEVGARWVDRYLRAVTQIIEENRTLDGTVNHAFLSASATKPTNVRTANQAVIVGARFVLTARFCQTA